MSRKKIKEHGTHTKKLRGEHARRTRKVPLHEMTRLMRKQKELEETATQLAETVGVTTPSPSGTQGVEDAGDS